MHRRSTAARATLLISVLTAAALGLAGCTADPDENGPAVTGIIPAPASFTLTGGQPFTLTADSRLVAVGDGAAAAAETFAAPARAATGFALPVVEGEAAASDIALVVADGEADGANEGYTLEIGGDGVRIGAATAAGLFWGTQSLRQLLPADIGRTDDPTPPQGGWVVPAASVADQPRFAYRGAMLDVARHFFSVEEVLRFVDAIALLKLNVLHLHLTDDQGWRLEIESWPELTGIGASTSVGGAGGGFYTHDDYRRIVAYAAERFVTIVPEIDLPGHTSAALSAYPELNCDGAAPAPYEGIEVGFSSLCAAPERADTTDRFLADVTREVAELTPGPWLHLGGDESLATPADAYLDLVRRIAQAGAATGKTLIGWHEMGASRELPPGTVGQYWSFVEPAGDAVAQTRSFVEQGGQVILSPADVAYLDMTYAGDPQTPLGRPIGQDWAKGPTTLEEAYLWEPTAIVPGIGEDDILGLEAPVWTETLTTMSEVEFMVFPRIAAIAELAWSPRPDADTIRETGEFFARVARFGQHLDAMGVAYHRVPEIAWAE
ncbi:beta-N-acetylhexosaminidase [Agromyces neolithicus]|uniref:beta-N-acetylhexosaminidase n=1 Tax=Agromyces neolithicus TaxID=269420 RepID=A0ABN2M582_9MICO